MRPHVLKDKAQMSVAWWMPRWLVKWCTIRVFANATQGAYSNQDATTLTVIEALKRWEQIQ